MAAAAKTMTAIETVPAYRWLRRLLGGLMLLGIPLAGILLSLELEQEHDHVAEKRLAVLTDTAAVLVEQAIADKIGRLQTLVTLEEQGVIVDRDEFIAAARHLGGQDNGFVAINRMDAGRVIVAVTPYDRNKSALGRKVGATPEVVALLDTADRTGKPMATVPVPLFQGGKGIATYFPIRHAGQTSGYVNGVIDLGKLAAAISERLDPALRIDIFDSEGGESRGVPASFDSNEHAMNVLNRHWILRVTLPVPESHIGLYLRQSVVVAAFVLLAGGLIAVNARERRRTVQERQRLRDAIEAIPLGFSFTDGKQQIVLSNDSMAKMFPVVSDLIRDGAPLRELYRAQATALGLPVEAVDTWADEQVRLAGLSERNDVEPVGGGRWHRVVQRRTAEGGIVQVRMDVTELREARLSAEERARLLQASERRYHDLCAEIGVINWTVAAGGSRFLAVDGGLHRLMGRSDAEACDFAFWIDSVVAEDRPAMDAFLSGIRAGDRAIDHEFRVRGAHGDPIWLNVKGVPSAGDGNGPPVISGIMIDITERRKADAARLQAQSAFATAINQFSDFVALYDADDRLVVFNDAYRKFDPDFAKIFVLGKPYEQIVRDYVREGRIPEAKGREEEWISSRLAAHRSGGVAREFQFADGQWYLNRDQRLPDGSTLIVASNVTPIREALAKAELEHSRLLDAIESLPASFLMFDAGERLVVANEAGLDRFAPAGPRIALGASAEDCVRTGMEQGFVDRQGLTLAGQKNDPDDLLRRRMERFRAGNTDVEYRSEDGRWFRVVERRTKEGGLISVRFDLTDIRNTEARLAEVNDQFQAILDNAPFAIFMKDRDGRYLLGNSCFRDWYLPEGREPVGLTAFDFLPRERAEYGRQLDQTIIRSGRPHEEERPFAGKVPEITDIRISNFPIRNVQGEVIGIAGFAADISETKKAERERRSAELELGAIIENLNSGLITIDDAGIVRSFSKPAERLFGYAASEVVGRNVAMLMPEGIRDVHDSKIRAYLTTGEAKVIGIGREVEARRKDGSIFPADLSICELPPVDGQRRFAGMMRDETLRRELEHRLQHAERVESLGRLTGGIAHDFNNILGAIALNLEMIEPDLAGNEEAAAMLAIAMRATHRGRSITKQLLTVAGRQALQPVAVDAAVLLAEARELVRSSLGDKYRIEIEADAGTRVLVDPGAFESAIVNLVINARDAMADGGEVRLAAKPTRIDDAEEFEGVTLQPGRYVEVSVTDSGSGMSPEILAKATEPFFTTKGVGKGTGLGLSMVFGFARQSRGAAVIQSEPGLGTTVSLFLPAPPEATEEPEAGRAARRNPARKYTGNVLVVEDDPQVLTTVKAQLSRLGFNVLTAMDGGAARAICEQQHELRFVVSDVRMPGPISGVDLARWLRDDRPGLPVILMSGFVSDVEERDGIAELGVPFLRKPFGKGELVAIVDEVMFRLADAARSVS